MKSGRHARYPGKVGTRSHAATGIAPRTLALVFGAMLGLFVLTTFVARWYERQREVRAERYFSSGTRLAGRGRERQAIEEFRSALAVSRGNARYRLAIAQALFKLRRLDEAAIYFHELLETDPGDGLANLMLARIAANEAKMETAVNYYHRAIFGYWRERPEQNRMEARWELVSLLAMRGANKQVIAELLELADQAPNDANVRKRVARMLLQYGSATQSAELLREVLRQNRRDAVAQAGLGEAELALENYAAAQSAFRRAVREDPRDQASRKALDLVDDILELDPTLRGLSSEDRYRRSRTLVERALTSLDQCLATQKAPPVSAQRLAERAAKSLARRRRPSRMGDAAESGIALAEQLWTARGQTCGPGSSGDPAVARVLERLNK